jgi:hypothetical protein
MATTATAQRTKSVPSTSRKVLKKVERKDSSIMRALRKVARMGAAAGRRAKAAAKRLARMVKAAAVKTAQAVKRAAQKVAKMAAPAARVLAKPFVAAARAARTGYRTIADSKLGDIARNVWAQVSKTWRTVLKPFLKEWGLLFSVAAWLTGVAVAPITTAVVTGVAGLLALAFSKGLEWLEQSDSKLARITRDVLEAIGQAVRVAFYIGSGLIVLLTAAVSLPFAVLVATELTLRAVDWWPFEKTGSAFFEGFVQGLDEGAEAGYWQGRAEVAASPGPAQAPRVRPRAERQPVSRSMPRDYIDTRGVPTHETANVNALVVLVEEKRPAGSFLRAKGTEELWGTEHDRPFVNDTACSACGSTEGQLRAKSHRRDGDGETEAWLCSDCYDHECEDNALAFTGVSLKTRSVEVRLNETGIQNAPAYFASKADPASLHWMESAWWRDRDGTEHAREKICLMDGLEVARIVHDYKRKVYRASVLGVLVKNGVKTSWSLAQRAAEDELMDEGAAVRRHEDAAVEVVGEAPLRQQSKKG